MVLLGGDAWFDFDPCISPDGQHLFFASNRPANGIATAKTSMHIWVADRQGSEWSSPRLVENVNSESKDGTPTVARDGMLYFFSDRQAEPNKNSIYESKVVDLYVSFKKHGDWSEPVNLGPIVNSGDEEDNPVVSPDGKQFYFGRNGTLYVVPVSAIAALKKADFR